MSLLLDLWKVTRVEMNFSSGTSTEQVGKKV